MILELPNFAISKNHLRSNVTFARFSKSSLQRVEDSDLIKIHIDRNIYPENESFAITDGYVGDFDEEKKRFEEYVAMEFGKRLIELGIIKFSVDPEFTRYTKIKAEMYCVKDAEQR